MEICPIVRRPRAPVRRGGFTLIELMVTVAVLALVMSLAVPSLRTFLERNQTAAIANEFSAGVNRARMEAITRNTCVTMCQTANASAALPVCASSGDDWQRGWVIFENPTCVSASTPTSSTVIFEVRPGQDTAYQMTGSTRYELIFDGRGLPNNSLQANLVKTPEGTSFRHARTLCVSTSGRVTIRKYDGTSCL